MTATGDYIPPTEPRPEAVFGKIYRELRECDDAASKLADRQFPQADFPRSEDSQQAWSQAEKLRNEKWSEAQAKELNRLLLVLASREHVPVLELKDVRTEGDARVWFADLRKRARLGKSEADIQKDLAAYREINKTVRLMDKEAKSKAKKK